MSDHIIKFFVEVEKMKKLLKLFAEKALKMESKEIKVAGVTFKDGRKSRQATLRRIKFGDKEFENAKIVVTLDQEEFEGKPALAVLVNDQKIGYIPATLVSWCLENEITNVGGLRVHGGGDYSYGAVITVVVRKKQ